jgi:hypothetical protein
MTAVLEAPTPIRTGARPARPVPGAPRAGVRPVGARPAIRPTTRPSAAPAARPAPVLAALAVAVVLLLAGALLAGALVAGVARAAGAGGPVAEASGELHRVGPGETLWSIAESLDPDGPRAPVVAALAGLNGGSTSVDPGDVIALPELPG